MARHTRLSLASGQVRYLAPNPESRRQVEVEGSPALVVEVVSDSSVGKDTKRTPAQG